MSRPWWDKPYQDWERRPVFTTKDGRQVYPMYALGAHGDRYGGGTIEAYDTEVALDDMGFPPALRHRVGFLTWHRSNVIEYVDVRPEWQCQGIARHMLCLAREVCPGLRHAPPPRSDAGELFVRATNPEQADPDWDVAQEAPPAIPVPSRFARVAGHVARIARRAKLRR